MKTTPTVFIRLFFWFAGFLVFSCRGMQSDVIFLEDALKTAQGRGIDQYHLAELEEQLIAIADKNVEELPIARRKAYELIEEAETQQIIDQTHATKSPAVPSRVAETMHVSAVQSLQNANMAPAVFRSPLSRPAVKPTTQATTKPLNIQDYFDKRSPVRADFTKAQGKLLERDEKIDQAVAAGNDSLYLELSLEKEKLEKLLQEKLKRASRSPWFYTGDLLWRSIASRQYDPLLAVNNVHGPVYATLDDGTPLSGLSLKNPFVYVVSSNQIEDTCGFSALANLVAVNAQVSQGQPITFARTRELAEKVFSEAITNLPAFKKLQRGGAVEYSADVDLIPSAVQLNIDPNSIELVSPETIGFLHTALKTGKKVDAIKHLKEKLQTLPVTYFIYNVAGCHWVLLAVVRKEGVSTMYLFDSLNAPLRAGNGVTKLVSYIDDLLEPEVEEAIVDLHDLPPFLYLLLGAVVRGITKNFNWTSSEQKSKMPPK